MYLLLHVQCRKLYKKEVTFTQAMAIAWVQDFVALLTELQNRMRRAHF